MKDFLVTWAETKEHSVAIPALNADGAYDKWRRGEYDPDSVNVATIPGHHVEVHEA